MDVVELIWRVLFAAGWCAAVVLALWWAFWLFAMKQIIEGGPSAELHLSNWLGEALAGATIIISKEGRATIWRPRVPEPPDVPPQSGAKVIPFPSK